MGGDQERNSAKSRVVCGIWRNGRHCAFTGTPPDIASSLFVGRWNSCGGQRSSFYRRLRNFYWEQGSGDIKEKKKNLQIGINTHLEELFNTDAYQPLKAH